MSYLVTLLSRQFLTIAAKSLALRASGAAIHPALALHEHSPTRGAGAPQNSIAFALDDRSGLNHEMGRPVSFAASDDFASEALYVAHRATEFKRTK
jgi:hypothetical protein